MGWSRFAGCCSYMVHNGERQKRKGVLDNSNIILDLLYVSKKWMILLPFLDFQFKKLNGIFTIINSIFIHS